MKQPAVAAGNSGKRWNDSDRPAQGKKNTDERSLSSVVAAFDPKARATAAPLSLSQDDTGIGAPVKAELAG